jgi:hypothetical protein
MAGTRPPLGFEYEISLALIDTAQALTFSETPYPAIVGDFQVIVCTRDMRCVPPVNQVKALACGYNPAALIIPAPTIPGTLAFSGWDKAADETTVMSFNGSSCVARIVTRIDDTTVRTWYCNYLTPRTEVQAPAGDDPGSVTVDGWFATMEEA